ncbi:amino acid adenylation domain-containing protein [Streptomyces sp. NPDC048254]|uniref:amino acid adenylation domain-containing protein n=1 Tax=Streptomyces sp. NPDC048254 TaxID=3365525 RepID=UPI0037228E6C
MTAPQDLLTRGLSPGTSFETAGVHDVFARRAREHPAATAVASVAGPDTAWADTEQLTFAELDALADRLAHRLIALGVGTESRVGICVEPSAGLAVAMLGIMKAGAAFVPLDPDYPAARLSHLLEHSGAAVVVAQPETAARLPHGNAELLLLDAGFTEIAGEPALPPRVAVSPDSTACVIYTSGSTGAPKGVLITHRGLTNLAQAAAGTFGLGPGQRFLQLASVSFSAALEEIFPALLSGATLLMAGYQRALPTVRHFLQILERYEVTGFEITTAYWHQLGDELAESGQRLPDTVRWVVMGGDRVRPDRVLAWRESGIPLIHVYGPTESTATATYHHSGRTAPRADGLLPIGTAIDNTDVRLLDGDLLPVARGDAGEVFVAGRALARGYHRAPGETAARFLPDPYGPAGGRMYRTGDMARLLPDGQLEFLGRTDNQVKIRGFRVEPGEIEAVLQQHPAVRQALVTVERRGDGSESAVLLAHVTPATGERPAQPDDPRAAQLHDYLTGLLPAYMVPATVTVLDAIPLTAHGKVDFAALSSTAPGGWDGPAAGRPARPGTEADLAAIWRSVLKLDHVAADDEFLALGGNSLQAVKIAARLHRELGIDILPNDLLASRTVAQLATLIDGRRPDGQQTPQAAQVAKEVEIREMAQWARKRAAIEASLARYSDGRRAAPISPAQQGLYMLGRLAGDIPLYNEAWQCRLTGTLDRGAFNRAIEEIARRHESLRTSFGLLGGSPVQFVAPDADIPVRYVDVSTRPHDVPALREAEIREPIDPAVPPLLRVLVLSLSPTEHIAVFTAHHLIVDFVSVDVFTDELAACYAAFHTDRDPDLPAPSLQYGNYALWQRNHLRGENLDRLVDYWRGRLADPEPEPLDLGFDRPVPETVDYRGRRLAVDLPAALREAVHTLARREGVTPFMVLLTCFYSLLHVRSGSDDLCVGTPVANRGGPLTDRLIGCVNNTVVLRQQVPTGVRFRDLLATVRDNCLGAYAHQALPFNQLVEKLGPRRYPGRSPYFQVLFGLEDAKALERSFSGLTLDQNVILPTGYAKFELVCVVEDHGDRLEVGLTYRTSLFDEATARDLASAYERLLTQYTTDPDQPVLVGTDAADTGGRRTPLSNTVEKQ